MGSIVPLLVGAMLPLLGIASGSHGVAPTCDGRPVTLVGSPAIAELDGTAGDDVILTNGSGKIRGGDGDDLICVTGRRPAAGPSRVMVKGDAGADHVDTTAVTTPVTTFMDDESSYPGTGTVDSVVGGDGRDRVVDHSGRADISTGGGDDYVIAYGDPYYDGGRTGDLDVDLGSGDDVLATSGTEAQAQFAAGPGTDRIRYLGGCGVGRDAATLHIDNLSGTMACGSIPEMEWSGIELFDLRLGGGDVVFRGGPTAERLAITPVLYQKLVGTLVADMGEGDDDVLLTGYRALTTVHLDGGNGRDTLEVAPYGSDQNGVGYRSHDVRVDLSAGTLAEEDGFASGTVHNIEDVAVDPTTTIELTGNGASNRLETVGQACGVQLDGRGGDDVILVRDGDRHCTRPRLLQGGSGDDLLLGSPLVDRLEGGPGADDLGGGPGRDVLIGGAGSDLLRGTRGDDELYGGPGDDRIKGGPGRDHAFGGPGVDTCHAERTASCEH